MSYLPNNQGLLGNAAQLAQQLRQSGMAGAQPTQNVRAKMENLAAQTNAQAEQETQKKLQQQQAMGNMLLSLGIGAAIKGISGAIGAGAGQSVNDAVSGGTAEKWGNHAFDDITDNSSLGKVTAGGDKFNISFTPSIGYDPKKNSIGAISSGLLGGAVGRFF